MEENNFKIVPVEISARHIHLSADDFAKLFPHLPNLEKDHDLKQPQMFASRQFVTIVGTNDKKLSVRVLGPHRDTTQIELSWSEAHRLGLKPPIKISGDLDGSVGVTISTPEASLKLTKGLIVAKRHLHIDPTTAVAWHLQEGQIISAEFLGPRGAILGEIMVRLLPDAKPSLHLDTDEGNAVGIFDSSQAKLLY